MLSAPLAFFTSTFVIIASICTTVQAILHCLEKRLCFHFHSLETDDRLHACENYLPVRCQRSRNRDSYRETDYRLHYPNH